MDTPKENSAEAKVLRWIDARPGMTDAEFGRLTSVPKSFISAMRNDGQRLTLLQAVRIKEATGLSLDYLYDEAMTEPPDPGAKPIVLSDEQRRVLGWLEDLGFDKLKARVWRDEGEPGRPAEKGRALEPAGTATLPVPGEARSGDDAKGQDKAERRRPGRPR